jgi:DNA-binding MarR family transcriptional regulator
VVRTLQAELKQRRPFKNLRQEAHLSVLRTAAMLEHAFEGALKPYGITQTQYNVLRILRGAGENGLCRHEVRDRMLRPVPDVTRLLDRLEQMDLIVRERGGEDRRFVTTRITRAGLRLLAGLDDVVDEIHDRLLGHLDEAPLRSLVDLLARVRNNET